MPLTLTTELLTDLQFDLGIDNTETVFTDDELNRLYNRASGVYYKTEVLAFRALLADAAKWTNYTEGQTSEDRSDRFKQVQAFLTYLETVVLQGTTGQYAMVHIRSVPTPCRDVPFDRYPTGYGRSYGWGRRCGPY